MTQDTIVNREADKQKTIKARIVKEEKDINENKQVIKQLEQKRTKIKEKIQVKIKEDIEISLKQ